MKRYFQEKYLQESEPWNYSFRAAEILRHQTVAKTVAEARRRFSAVKLNSPSKTEGCATFIDDRGTSALEKDGMHQRGIRILDIGCSLGQLTKQLLAGSGNVTAMDISEVAVKKARTYCRETTPTITLSRAKGLAFKQRDSSPATTHWQTQNDTQIFSPHFLVGSSLSLPFQKESFEIAVLSDGIQEWQLSEQEKKATLMEVHKLLSVGGKAIFTDYLKPKNFALYISRIEKSPLKIIEVRYLHDRLWYQFESWFKAIRHWNWVRKMLSCLWIAKFLRILSMLFGRYGSRHILVIAEKKG